MSHDDHDKSRHHEKINVWRTLDLVGIGDADADPDGRCPKRAGEELGVARALGHLTRQLFATTVGDIASVTGEEVTVR
jgi:hypothetical protein